MSDDVTVVEINNTVTVSEENYTVHILEGMGPNGFSAYQLAVAGGFEGTEEEWLASLKPDDSIRVHLRHDDFVDDGVLSGWLPVATGLDATEPAGSGVIESHKVETVSGSDHTCTISKDTYVDITAAGVFVYTEVANGAGAPAISGTNQRLAKVVTDATVITNVVDLRTFVLVKESVLPETGSTGTVTEKTATATLTTTEFGDILVSASADYPLTMPTAVGNKGKGYRFTKTDANYNLITLDADGTETFNYPNDTATPTATYVRLNTYGAKVEVVSDGSNWIVVSEDIGQVPECHAWLSSNQNNITSHVMTLVDLDSEEYDIGNNFDTTTHKYTIPISGKYSVLTKIDWFAPIADKLYYNYVYNGAVDTVLGIKTHAASTDGFSSQGDIVVKLTAGDTLELKARQDSGFSTPDIEGGILYKTMMTVKLQSKV